MSNTTTEINWHNTLPQNLEGHKCIAVTKTGETIEGDTGISHGTTRHVRENR